MSAQELAQDVVDDPQAGDAHRIQIAACHLTLGMYVVELDRPWLDTPFLLDGFMIDSDVELVTLNRYCAHAWVDVGQSDPVIADVIRRSDMNAAAPAATALHDPWGAPARPGVSDGFAQHDAPDAEPAIAAGDPAPVGEPSITAAGHPAGPATGSGLGPESVLGAWADTLQGGGFDGLTGPDGFDVPEPAGDAGAPHAAAPGQAPEHDPAAAAPEDAAADGTRDGPARAWNDAAQPGAGTGAGLAAGAGGDAGSHGGHDTGGSTDAGTGAVPVAGSHAGTASVPAADPTRTADAAAGTDAARTPDTAPVPGAVQSVQAARLRRSRRTYKSRADVRISQETRERFRRMVRETAVVPEEAPRVVERLKGWLAYRFGGEKDARPPATGTALLDALRIARYPDRHDTEAGLPNARHVFGETSRVFGLMCSEIRAGHTLDFRPLVEAVHSLTASIVDNPDALALVARLRDDDPEPYPQALKVAIGMATLGRHLGMGVDQIEQLALIGLLADVGKLRIPRALLEKPGMLSPSEFMLVKEHVNLSMKVLADSRTRLPDDVLVGISQHHERVDGSGYPKGLVDDKIGVHGKIAALVDAYTALTAARNYAHAYSPQEALMSLYEWSNTSFSEPLVEQFVHAVGVFPVGNLVELTSGEVAIVIALNRTRRLEPRVLVLSAPNKQPLPQPVPRDLRRHPAGTQPKPPRIARGLPAGAYGFHVIDAHFDGLPT